MAGETPRRLGRGLEALMASKSMLDSPATNTTQLRQIRLADIRPNPFQPRKHFAKEEMDELTSSIRANGLIQAIAVRSVPASTTFELIAGERRLRAVTALGWLEIPAIIKEVDDPTLLSLALVENLQRTDLNPVEEAEGYQHLLHQFQLTQQQVAEFIGKDRSTVANMLRLLKLPASVRRMLKERKISVGHARALLAIGEEQKITEVAREIVTQGLSVRDVEQRTKTDTTSKRIRSPRVASSTSAELRIATDALRHELQTDVAIRLTQGEHGKIEITFYSSDDLQRLLEKLLVEHRD